MIKYATKLFLVAAIKSIGNHSTKDTVFYRVLYSNIWEKALVFMYHVYGLIVSNYGLSRDLT